MSDADLRAFEDEIKQVRKQKAEIAKIIKDDFSTNANHIVLKPKKKKFEPGKPLDYKEAICYDSDESSEGDLFDDLEVLGEEG